MAKSYYILKFNVFAWFQSVKKHSLFKFVKTQAKHQTLKYCKILPGFYTYMWDMAFEGFDFKFCNTSFLGTTLVPILSFNSSNSFQSLNKKYINKAYKCDFTAKRGTPNGTQKSSSKIVNSELSSDVSVMCIVILDQKLHTCQYSWFFDIPLNLQKHHFFVWN
mgnify:FL=1